MKRLVWLPFLALLGACGPASVSGQVDGQGVGGARTALFETLEIDLGPIGEYNLLFVLLTDIPEACDVYEAFFDDIISNCDDRCDDYRDIAEEYLGAKEYWALSLSAVSNGSFEQEYDYEDQPADEEFRLDFSRYDAEPLYDSGECEDACQDGDLLEPDAESGNDGTLEILVDDGDIVKGRFEVDMGGDESVRGSFTAEHCNMGSWLPWI